VGSIAAGPDGALWFTERVACDTICGGKIGRITTEGAFTEFLPPPGVVGLGGIATGPDGALWFGGAAGCNFPFGCSETLVGRSTTSGVITLIPAGNTPKGITAGPGGALWFTTGNQIGRMSLTPQLLVSGPPTIAATGFQHALVASQFQYQLSTLLGSADFAITGGPNWLIVSPSTGTATVTPSLVNFSINAAANTLSPGAYGPVTITFTNSTNGLGTQTRTATLTVLPRTDTHDFNGDSYSDIFWRDSSSNLAMWLMNGARVVSPIGFGLVPTSWVVVGQRDFNGDGYADLLWRNNTTNVICHVVYERLDRRLERGGRHRPHGLVGCRNGRL
jgi:FG-GAP-like repeat